MAKTKKKDICGSVTKIRYEGQYIAFDPSKGKKIIAHARNAGSVINKARKLGVAVPAIVFVPRSDLTYIYYNQCR